MLTPVLSVSSVTGAGLDWLRKLLAALPKRRQHQVCTGIEEGLATDCTYARSFLTTFDHTSSRRRISARNLSSS